MFNKLKNTLGGFGFFPGTYDAKANIVTDAVTGYLNAIPPNNTGYVDMPDATYPLGEGESNSFFYFSRQSFLMDYGKHPFAMFLHFDINNSISDHGVVRYFVHTNLGAGLPDQTWWPEAFDLFKNAVSRLHDTFKCVHTIATWEPDDDDLESAPITEFENGTRPFS